RPFRGVSLTPIWNGFSLSQMREVVTRSFIRLSLRHPSAARVFKSSHEFLLLCVHRNHWVRGPAECPDLPVQVAELGVAIRMLRALARLNVGLQSVAHLFQTSADRHAADRMSGPRQFSRDGPCGFAGPLQRAHG